MKEPLAMMLQIWIDINYVRSCTFVVFFFSIPSRDPVWWIAKYRHLEQLLRAKPWINGSSACECPSMDVSTHW